MDTVSVVLRRHSIKAFDPNKKLTTEQAEKLETLLQFSPSSTNSQPWRFTVASTDEDKTRMAKPAAGGSIFNKRKILDVPRVVVFCAKMAMNDTWLGRVVDQEESDGHFVMPEAKAANHKDRTFFAGMYRKELRDDNHQIAKQVYLNVGSFLLGATAMGLDTAPIEGLDSAVTDAEFGLKEKGLTSVVVVPAGYYSVEDFNAVLPKSRLPLGTMLMEV